MCVAGVFDGDDDDDDVDNLNVIDDRYHQSNNDGRSNDGDRGRQDWQTVFIATI